MSEYVHITVDVELESTGSPGFFTEDAATELEEMIQAAVDEWPDAISAGRAGVEYPDDNDPTARIVGVKVAAETLQYPTVGHSEGERR